MSGLKLTRFRKVVFTDAQMMVAKNSGKFPDNPKLGKLEQHRPFIEWLFLSQHKCRVVDHLKLRYNYMVNNGVTAIAVEGDIGDALQFK